MKWKRHKSEAGAKGRTCPHCGAQLDFEKKPKKWHEKTSVTLCIAAALAVIGLGFIHIITGVVSPFELPFDVALKESFGYRETFVNARKIQEIPYTAAKLKYPLSCRALQRKNYLESGKVFETRMASQLKQNMTQWQEEFETTVGKPRQRWQDRLEGKMDVSEMDPEDANTCNNLGIISARRDQYETAISNFGRAVQRNPVLAEAYFNRGHVYVAIGQMARGISDFGKAVEIKRTFAAAYVDRGIIYAAMNQYDEAVSDFSKAVEIDPKLVDVYLRRSLVCCAKGDYHQAWADVRKIESLGLTVPRGYLIHLRAASQRQR
ncbi:MAG: tetratricopeptide repeat protein [Planctomycetota bacterium]